MAMLRCLLLIMTVCVTSQSGEPEQTSPEHSVNEVVRLLKTCPSWLLLAKGDQKAKRDIIDHLEKIARHDPITIRQAVVRYTSALWSRQEYNAASASAVFLLNRFIFNAPEKEPLTSSETPLFGGWAGTPKPDRAVNRLWPFTYDSEGTLQLTGRSGGYSGPPYRGIEEFDYFARNFGLRVRPGKR